MNACDNFIEYWDKEIQRWALTGTITENERIWANVCRNLKYDLMPEPYWGDPRKCSTVIVNYNPACAEVVTPDNTSSYNNVIKCNKDSVSGLMAARYSNTALSFPLLDKPQLNNVFAIHYMDSIKWWTHRINWIERNIKEYERITGKETILRPFALELCGWHSNRWQPKYTQELLEELKSIKFGEVLNDSLRNSELKIGFAIASAFSNIILPYLGYKDITKELIGIEEWHPIKNVSTDKRCTSGSNRAYKILRNEEGLFIICSWAGGTNNAPSKQFEDADKQCIKAILESIKSHSVVTK